MKAMSSRLSPQWLCSNLCTWTQDVLDVHDVRKYPSREL